MSKKFSYEQSTKELEEILQNLEEGNIEIDSLFIKVKRATELINSLKTKLKDTESQVLSLLEKDISEDAE